MTPVALRKVLVKCPALQKPHRAAISFVGEFVSTRKGLGTSFLPIKSLWAIAKRPSG